MPNDTSLPDPLQLVRDKAARLGISEYALLGRADVAKSSWSNWTRGLSQPNTRTIQRILAVEPDAPEQGGDAA